MSKDFMLCVLFSCSARVFPRHQTNFFSLDVSVCCDIWGELKPFLHVVGDFWARRTRRGLQRRKCCQEERKQMYRMRSTDGHTSCWVVMRDSQSTQCCWQDMSATSDYQSYQYTHTDTQSTAEFRMVRSFYFHLYDGDGASAFASSCLICRSVMMRVWPWGKEIACVWCHLVLCGISLSMWSKS